MNRDDSSVVKPLLLDLTTVLLLLVPLLYATGWSYAYHYFGYFHLGSLGLEIPKEYFFLYSFQAIVNQPIWAGVALICFLSSCVCLYWCLNRKTHRAQERIKNKFPQNPKEKKRFIPFVGIYLSPFLVLLMFMGFYALGGKAAGSVFQEQEQSGFSGYARVKVWLSDGARTAAGPVATAWEKGCFRLLLRNKNNVYIFQPGKPGDKLPTEIIPTGQIRSIRILPQYQGCKPQ